MGLTKGSSNRESNKYLIWVVDNFFADCDFLPDDLLIFFTLYTDIGFLTTNRRNSIVTETPIILRSNYNYGASDVNNEIVTIIIVHIIAPVYKIYFVLVPYVSKPRVKNIITVLLICSIRNRVPIRLSNEFQTYRNQPDSKIKMSRTK